MTNTIKNIYITTEKGLDLVGPIVVDAISEVMNTFPEYKQFFPIINLGNWKDEGYKTARNGRIILEPYKSVDWYIERAKLAATLDEDVTTRQPNGAIARTNRWNGKKQIKIDQLLQDLSADPYAKNIPQLPILITKQDLYGSYGNRLLNFCLGVSDEDSPMIVSVARFLDERGQLDVEGFKTVVMHEFGHTIGLTREGRVNTNENLGAHCMDAGCIMQQESSGDFTKITNERLKRKRRGQPPICADCIEEGYKFFSRQMYKHIQRQQNNGGR